MTKIQRTPGNAKGRCRTVSAGEFIWTVATAGGQGNTVPDGRIQTGVRTRCY